MDFFNFFAQAEEIENDAQRYSLLELIFLTMTAVLSGAKTWCDVHQFGESHLSWLRQYLPFTQGIPSKETIADLVCKLHSSQLNDIFINFVNELRQSKNLEQIPLDGKNLRNCFGNEAKSALHSITIQSKMRGVILIQHKSPRWRNEQQGVLEILQTLKLRRAIVSVYACNTQKKIVEQLKDKQADYVVALNNNHAMFRKEIAAYFHKMERENPQLIDYYDNINTGRQYKKLPVDEWLSEPMRWEGIQTVLCAESLQALRQNRKLDSKLDCYISSLNTALPQLAESIREHLSLKKRKVHWMLDVVYRDVRGLSSKDSGEKKLTSLRYYALNLARLHPAQLSLRMKLKTAACSDAFREELLFGVGE
ncbi:ISAs1 family transposase [Testudinibacter aquarius]|uniref:ISAs1 family transposase n=1 Tax=Testudinibacter aquarius TaxID=1524974 RepID=A0A4R3XVP3_9PAST|nr:ISAs1 family transposase [Testudinibacter aquarius]KAE9525496.1 hypothetical protein A1D24_04505 [Testudinibacter aquarius]TCV82871.1 putative transposase YbfD/YdcC [Testudinibacter aquarius]TNG92183.1 ISAs1 family transposase [Testudinibacter aquarius]